MKIRIHRPGEPPVEFDGADCIRIEHGPDAYELRPNGAGLLVRIVEHEDRLAMDLAMFPSGGNGVTLKGGLR